MPDAEEEENVRTMTPKTFQPFPRTSSRLRPNDSPMPRSSRTIAGMTAIQIVIRIQARHDQEHEARSRSRCPSRMPATMILPSFGADAA